LSEKIQDEFVRKEVATQTALQIDDLIQDSVLDNGKPLLTGNTKQTSQENYLLKLATI
jgi:type I restriction enzyme R subunit